MAIPSPLISRPGSLPFGDLAWERFEQLAHDLLLGLPWVKPETAHCYGTKGQAQRGIDLIVQHQDGSWWAFSNKRYQKYQPNHVQTHIAETTYQADQYVILISGTASADVRDEVRKHSKWELWDAVDLSQRIRLEVSLELARRLVDHHFGPIWRRDFLGLPAVGAFIPPTDYFRSMLATDRLLHHAFPLVGRQELVQQFREFAETEAAQVFLLPGRGGIGKTRLLRELTEWFDVAHPDRVVRLLNEGVPLTTDAFNDLPAAPCLIVVDDAHRRSDLCLLLAWFRQRPESRLVLATRPQGTEYLCSELTRAGFDTRRIRHLPSVDRLRKSDVRELAVHVLGAGQDELADRLTQATRDCPLVTVVGGRLLSERSIPPELLERDEYFQQEVLNRFRDEMLGRASENVPTDLCRRLLEVIAALSPVPADSQPFHQRLAEFLRLSTVDVVRALGELERISLLVRRGGMLRLTPDVLADHILYSACLTPQNAVTGFADQVFAGFAEDSLPQLLRNLAELDWRVRTTTDVEPVLLDRVWNRIRGWVLTGDHQLRSHLLRLLGDSANFLPARVLELVTLVIRNPAPEPVEAAVSGPFSCSHVTVIREIPQLLSRCALTRDCLPSCLDLLWELSRSDDRPTNPNPDHPFRIITEIAEYHPHKPLWVNQAVLDAARRWISQPDAFTLPNTPLDALSPLLAKSGIQHETDGYRLVMRPFLVNHEWVRSLRTEVLTTLTTCLASPNLRVVLQAVRSLGDGLGGPIPYLNVEITDDDLQEWEGEQIQILDLFQDLIGRNPPPVVSLAVLRVVRIYRDGVRQEAVRERANALVGSIDQSFEIRLIRMLLPEMSRWDLLVEETGENPDTETRARALTESVVNEFHQRFPVPAAAVAELDRLVRELLSLESTCDVGNVIQRLMVAHPEVARDFAHQLIVRCDSPLAGCLRVVLACLHDVSPSDAMAACREALDTDELNLRRAVAFFCQWGLRTAPELHDDEPALFERLLADPDPFVHKSGIATLRRLAAFRPREAIERAAAIEVGTDTDTAVELCRLADQQWGGVPQAFTDVDIICFLDKLKNVNCIDYHLADFLRIVCLQVPQAVLGLFISRIESRELMGYRAGYQPVPYNFLHKTFESLITTERHREILRGIRDHALGKPGVTRHELADLYRHASLNYGPAGMEVLAEWLSAGDEQQLVTAVGLLIGAHWSLIFDRIDLTVSMLERADGFGFECFSKVSRQLHALATHGSKHGVAGQPFSQDVDVRDRATEVLKRLPIGSVSHRFVCNVKKSVELEISRSIAEAEAMDE